MMLIRWTGKYKRNQSTSSEADQVEGKLNDLLVLEYFGALN